MVSYNPLAICYLALLVLLASPSSSSFQSCDAFSLELPRPTKMTSFPTLITRHTISALRAEESNGEAEESMAESVAMEEQDSVAAVEEEVQAEKEEEESKEDLEVKALKEEIAQLEKALKDKKSQIQYLKDSNETYSKAGYARKVAEMENMRRTRSSQASSNQETSMANVLRSFLPVKDKLDTLKEQYSEDTFGKQYVALAGNFNSAMTALGVSEYTATVGEPLDRSRYLVVDEEHTTDLPNGTVLRPLKMGLELKGNVVRLAEVVGSLGEQLEEEKEKEAEQETTGEAPEEAEASD